ncbi:hypothetical protein [Nocardia gamkensis]|uniref:hypothetical protein n=1 Tax=Nocardia gamkensis TaxID=352869 RepID=UPI0037C5562A
MSPSSAVAPVVDSTGLVGPLITYLASLGANAADPSATGETAGRRGRAQAVLWDLVTPMAVTTIQTILPTDPQAREGIGTTPAAYFGGSGADPVRI